MNQAAFKKNIQSLFKQQEKLLTRRNRKAAGGNGIYDRYEYPVLTAAHAPLIWRYDFNPKTNPYLMERMFINTTFNAGAIFHEGKYLVVARVEGAISSRSSPSLRAPTASIIFIFGTIPS